MVARLSIVVGCLVFAACVSAQAAQKRKAEPPPPTPVLIASENAPTIKFQTIATAVPAGTIIGKRRAGLICSLGPVMGDIVTSKTVELDMRAFGNSFRQEFQAANYKLVGDDVALFGQDKSDAKYFVGAVVRDVKLDSCYLSAGYNPSAKASIAIEWQFFDPLERKVVYRANTVGRGDVGTAADSENQALAAAFGEATRALLTTQALYDFLNVSLPTTPQNAALPTVPQFRLKPLPVSTARFQDQATDIRAHVATVFANSGSGSGFFINDGYLVTNNHVVDGSKFIKVKLLTGREVVGEVVASNSQRDVALVKTEIIGLKGLPVRATEAGVGSQVFVIGSPLGIENEGTVTSGIISTYRFENEQRVIQSDVAVTHGNSGGPMVDETGNVIGITVYGRPDPNGKALNFFIPITDALDKLGVSLAAN
jgi:serine protease Do